MSLHTARNSFRAARSYNSFSNASAGDRKIEVKPGAIALRCIKTVGRVHFGQVYVGYPWAMRTDGTGTVETFMVDVGGSLAERKGADLFEPVKAKHRRLFKHLLTESEQMRAQRWLDALRDRCRGAAERLDAQDGQLVCPATPPSPFVDWLASNCLTAFEAIGREHATPEALYADYVAFVNARKIDAMDCIAFGKALDDRGAYVYHTMLHGARRAGICLRWLAEVRAT